MVQTSSRRKRSDLWETRCP